MNIRRAFCVLLILFGAVLDSYFYIFRFLADGTALPVAIMAALALELLLAFAVWNAQKSKIFTGVAVIITLYAVIQTSAGQTFALLSRDAVAGDTSATVALLMDEERKNLDRLDAEYRTITAQLATLKTAEDRADYAGTVYRATLRLSDLTKERRTSADKLAALADKNRNSEIVRVKKMSIYDFYASMPKWCGMDWLKFAFHTVLSFLIAIMTPIGLLTWDVKSASRILKKSALTEREVSEFVSRCWGRVVAGVSNRIMAEAEFYAGCERDNVVMSPGAYQECIKRAAALGIITREGAAVVTDLKLIAKKILKGA